jgi:hypothetical protein
MGKDEPITALSPLKTGSLQLSSSSHYQAVQTSRRMTKKSGAVAAQKFYPKAGTVL